MSLTIDDLGVTKEQLIELVADRLVDIFTLSDDGCEKQLVRDFDRKCKAAIDEAIGRLAEKNVLPNVVEYVEKLTLQETTKWGEKKGEPKTFVEYLVARAENYLTEKVDYKGKAKGEGDSYGWKENQTRIAYLVHEHLQFSIEQAMKKALENANASIIGGINAAVQMKLKEVAEHFKVEVKTK